MDRLTKTLKHLFSKKTALGRVIRTLLQSVLGLTGLVITVTALPGLMDFMRQSLPNTVGIISTFITLATAIWNGTEKLLSWLESYSEQ